MPQKLKSSFRLDKTTDKVESNPTAAAPGNKAPEHPSAGIAAKKTAEISAKLPDLTRPHRWGWEREGTSNVL